jgi:hypothetical protein
MISKIVTSWKNAKQFLKLHSKKRIKLADNKVLTQAQYDLVCRISDIFLAISQAANDELISPPQGGVFWEQAKQGLQSFDLYLRKDKKEIEHSFLLNNRFRDFPTIAYEYEEFTPKKDYWVRRYQRLAEALPKKWRVKIPAQFGEIGWNLGGYPINRWTSVNQERISAMYIAGILHHLQEQSAPKMLEIGGGAGEMGYVLAKALHNSTWYDCDLLGCLFHSAIHLAIMLPEKRHFIYVGNLELPSTIDQGLILRSAKEAAEYENAIINIPHFLINDFKSHLKLDFAYNTYSFGEMPKSSVEAYAELLADFLRDKGVLYEQNGHFPERGGDNVENILAKKFKQQAWPDSLDGRHLPNGPARVWLNNHLGGNLTSYTQINSVIASLNDHDDKIDIEFPARAWDKLSQHVF